MDSKKIKDFFLESKLGKRFLLGGAITVVLSGWGYSVKVDKEEKELQNKEWRAINADADSIYIDTDKGEFYAEKRLSKKDQQAIAELQAEKDSLIKIREGLIEQANKKFLKAIDNYDVKSMREALANGANAIDQKNSKGQTPLMQLLEAHNSAKAYICARELIPYADLGAQDNDGAKAADYAANIRTIKGEVLQREIKERKEKKVAYERNDNYIEITLTKTGYIAAEHRINSEYGESYVEYNVVTSKEEAARVVKESQELNTIAKVDNAINKKDYEMQKIDEHSYKAIASKYGSHVSYGKDGENIYYNRFSKSKKYNLEQPRTVKVWQFEKDHLH